ncbi:MAG TPA: SUMF1/EgtB/PvdO family nonheme iron enzyme [Planctomicrobium sp.]|nr:SUMF1/EgtB/PvdO family nonheme iron enzyme [Planctomicrobium sp.]
MKSPQTRSGLSRLEVTVGLLVAILLIGLAAPWVLHAREVSRRHQCTVRMARLAQALTAYEQEQGTFPAAAHWDTSALNTLALQESTRWDQFIGKNWAIELAPYLGHADLLMNYDDSQPICSEQNRPIREARVDAWICPVDEFNRDDNRFQFEPISDQVLEFARGNYALNGGTHAFHTSAGSTKTPTGDRAHLRIDGERREFEYWGNGIAGFNKAFGQNDFINGRSTLIAFNEIRAGIDPIDIRGCWALGHIAGSVTWGHGINGDAFGPNNPWARSDDIQGGGALNEKYGPDKLIELGMPCVSYIDKNQNAASRSRHVGGVNAAFLDGSVRFVSDKIDPSVWHYLHSRETPSKEFHQQANQLVYWPGSFQEAPPPFRGVAVQESTLTNSLGMAFVKISAGEFQMGVPDRGNDRDTPPETPPHPVRITFDYFLGTTEVTQGQFQRVMPPDEPASNDPASAQNKPAVNVTWYDAQTFCERLSALPEEKAAGRTYRLPTEAEWEYACRARTSEPYLWNSQRSVSDASGETAGISPALPLTTVASYPSNSLGLFDMRGNAWEWCSDWFDRDYYQRSRHDDPNGPLDGYAKVIRGGDWIYVGEGCFINYPILAPWKSSPFIGFRVVCVPTSSSVTETKAAPLPTSLTQSKAEHLQGELP